MTVELSNQIFELRQLISLNLLAIRTILVDRGIPHRYCEMLIWNAEQFQERAETLEGLICKILEKEQAADQPESQGENPMPNTCSRLTARCFAITFDERRK